MEDKRKTKKMMLQWVTKDEGGVYHRIKRLAQDKDKWKRRQKPSRMKRIRMKRTRGGRGKGEKANCKST